MYFRILSTLLLALLITQSAFTQDESPLTLTGDFRLALITSGTDTGFDNIDEEGVFALRSRFGAKYQINDNSSFKARLATTFTDRLEEATFTIQPDGRGLNRGSISFDELYYLYDNGDIKVQAGRFQHVLKARTNAGRSIARFTSNLMNIHWFDGVNVVKRMNNGWNSQVMIEYQNRGNTSYNYAPFLNFGNNEHNVAGYFGVENRDRDDFNIIQKRIGLFLAPDAFSSPDGYRTYAGLITQIAFDVPQEDLLSGGSFRIHGEFGQNLTATEFADGIVAVASVGVNNVADQHQFMIEFAKTGSQWGMANVFAPNGDEVELRYRFFATDRLWFDTRYRVRSPRVDGIPNIHGFFLRANFSY